MKQFAFFSNLYFVGPVTNRAYPELGCEQERFNICFLKIANRTLILSDIPVVIRRVLFLVIADETN